MKRFIKRVDYRYLAIYCSLQRRGQTQVYPVPFVQKRRERAMTSSPVLFQRVRIYTCTGKQVDALASVA